MTAINAYTYLAAPHCPYCAGYAYRQQVLRSYTDSAQIDEHGLPDDMIDREGNPVRPVFSTDEIAPGEVCDDCFRPLKEN